MRWIAGRILAPALWATQLWLLLLAVSGAAVALVCRGGVFILLRTERLAGGGLHEFLDKLARFSERLGYRLRAEIRRIRAEAATVSRDVNRFCVEQQASLPLDPKRETVFLLITCGQAVRNFLLSDVLPSLKERYNVVIISPYAYSDGFYREYSGPGVHVLPWFTSFRTVLERFFQFYFMSNSRSRTHRSWLENLEARAKVEQRLRSRYKILLLMRRSSDALGRVIGWRGMQGLYGSYFMAYLRKSLFRNLFSTYRPVLVISTTAHHPEAWPLTYFGRRYGAKTLANILSWDNTTTKPMMDVSCDHYTVWSEEMKRELVCQFPNMHPEVRVTGCPLFDLYAKRDGAISREDFLKPLGLDPSKPFILYATNTPSAMPDEGEIVAQYWEALSRSALAGKVNLLVRLHPKDLIEKYKAVMGRPGVAVTLAAKPHWDQSDRWLPNGQDMSLLLNSMLHAAVSVNVASTMSLESFALNLPTINVGFRASRDIGDHGSMWSFEMYHFSEHYHAILENGAVDLARSVDQLVDLTMEALSDPRRHSEAMRRTLEQKAAYTDGTSARRFVDVVAEIVTSAELQPDRQGLALPLSPQRRAPSMVEAAE